MRYDKDDIEYKDKADSSENQDTSYSELSPKLSLEYKPGENMMTYVTVSKGYRPGGYYTYAPEGYSKEYDKETLWSYEVGSKNSFLDNALIVNGAIYYMDISDMQVVNYINASQTFKNNAAEATSKGFEFDLKYRTDMGLDLFAAFGYNDTTFDRYRDFKGDYSDNTNPYAPEYNYSLGMQYRNRSGYFGRVDMNGYGKMYLDKGNKYHKDAYYVVNTKLGYEAESVDLYLYAQNLFDEEYDSVGYSEHYTRYSPPREMGVQLAYRF